jgi:hypothetical protein
VPLSGVASIDAAVARVRSETPAHLRSEIKERFAKVRETLTADDHMLLGLRLDRRMAWSDIAQVMGAQPAALRKRYQRLKERLEELADELLGDE